MKTSPNAGNWSGFDASVATALTGVAEQRGPRYAALAARLRMLISDGRIPVGTRLPSERWLAAASGLSRATVTSAYRVLADQGWAETRRGSGTWTRLPSAHHRQGAWAPQPAEEGVIDLTHAAQSAPPQVRAAFGAALDELPRYLPGHGYFPSGLPELRARIAARYASRGLPTDPEQIIVTSGALHGVAVALRLLLGAGDRILVEHPTYPNVLDAIDSHRAEAVPVPLDSAAGSFASALLRISRQTAPRAAYLMPDFQNPTGLLQDHDARRRVAASLEQDNVVAIIDETLADLGLDESAPAPFAVHARPELAITVGTLSKSVWGGLRVGWLRADRRTAQRLAAATTREQLSGPLLEQLAACFLLDDFDVILDTQRDRLRRQRDLLLSALAEHLPSWRTRTPSGGLVAWCQVASISSSALASAAPGRGLRLAAGPRFGLGTAFDDRLRLPFTQPAEVLVTATERLAALAADVTPVVAAEEAARELVL